MRNIFIVGGAVALVGVALLSCAKNSTGPSAAAPGVPTLVTPANGAAGQSITPTLYWEGSASSSSFAVQVSTDAGFGSTVLNQTGLTGLSATVSCLTNSTSYYWEVNATNVGGTSGWSSVWSFTTISAPAGMIRISGGTFMMGSATGDGAEQPAHQVTLSTFYMDSAEVTQGGYTSVMGVNPSSAAPDTRRPVESVTWFDAVLYCNARSKHDGRDTVYSYTSLASDSTFMENLVIDFAKDGYRLPTEAEWEYACRAGDTADYYWGADFPPVTTADTALIDANAVWAHNSGGSVAEVRTKLPNAWGLYDMVGNVQEWCNDWYDVYGPSAQTNPTGPATGSYNVIRGGNFLSGADPLRSAYRTSGDPTAGNGGRGFRCVARQ